MGRGTGGNGGHGRVGGIMSPSASLKTMEPGSTDTQACRLSFVYSFYCCFQDIVCFLGHYDLISHFRSSSKLNVYPKNTNRNNSAFECHHGLVCLYGCAVMCQFYVLYKLNCIYIASIRLPGSTESRVSICTVYFCFIST